MVSVAAEHPIMVLQMVRRLELSLCTAILSGHHEHGSPPSKDIKSGDSRSLELDITCISVGCIRKGGGAAPLVATRNTRAVVLPHFPGSLLLKSERG
jgi:hypothetical protein